MLHYYIFISNFDNGKNRERNNWRGSWSIYGLVYAMLRLGQFLKNKQVLT